MTMNSTQTNAGHPFCRDLLTRWAMETWPAIVTAILILAGYAGTLGAATISVPNGSFEFPTTAYATNQIDAWQITPKPAWYDESGGFTWDQLSGVFLNTSPTNADHIDNCDGSQALFLFAIPQAGLFQDYDSIDGTNQAPSHTFAAQFETGKSYQLTVGVIAGGGGMKEGASLQISLYYRDSGSNFVTVAATNLTFAPAAFPNTTHFVDYSVALPAVQASDPWAGRHLGMQLLSTVRPDLYGGYWDLDNVRLTSRSETVLVQPAFDQGQFRCTVQSEPGLRVEMLASPNLALPLSNWTSLGILTNETGALPFVDPAAGASQRYYQARQWP
jgi:hypothetical protein